MRPSFWLRLTAVLGAAGTLVAVISGSAGLGAGHQVLAALALPPLAAVVAAAWVEHQQVRSDTIHRVRDILNVMGLASPNTPLSVRQAQRQCRLRGQYQAKAALAEHSPAEI